jgi:hypothetical protein
MASLFFSVDVWRALREVVPAENIVAHEAVTLQDAITDFLLEQLSDHSEFRDLVEQTWHQQSELKKMKKCTQSLAPDCMFCGISDKETHNFISNLQFGFWIFLPPPLTFRR